ncbi:MAG TPA: TraR/DksA C4-type zinc finger protein [Candidatus Acidoferrales bacterium]|nr:TraR/DksA C4-type zinc finger protein [Candidatus Acidoferrales bacterium]
MDEFKMSRHLAKLSKRKDQVMLTLRYLEQERHQVEMHTEWLNQSAYRSRANLLRHLMEWYLEEKAQIEEALARIGEKTYGLCLACRQPIEAERLEASPETGFCGACQSLQDGLRARAR